MPQVDFLALTKAMEAYQEGDEVGFDIKSYGDGISMITDAGRGQGRGLFFIVQRRGDRELLVVLKVYKKESQKTPQRHLTTAKSRRDEYLKREERQ